MSHPGQYGREPTSPGADPSTEEYEVYVPAAPTMPPVAPYTAHQRGSGSPWQQPAGGSPADPPPQHHPRRPVLWWGFGAFGVVALIIVLLVATGVFDAKVDEPGSNPQATGNYAPPSPGQNHALRIVDKESGISYNYLGEGWKDYSFGTVLENQTTVGQYIVTQPVVPGGSEFIAQVTSGLLSKVFGSPSVADYPSALAEVETSVFGNYYPLPNSPTNQSEGALQIDGHDAYQRSADLTWDVEGYDSTGERVVLLLIDTGRSAPVLFYCSFPNTHAELYPLIEQVIASITVDS